MTPSTDYWGRLNEGFVPYQHCEDCGKSVFFPRVLCNNCGSTALGWRESAGLGTVYSATTVHERNADPYTVALIDLAEGIRVMARLDGATPDEPPIGRTVVVVAGQVDGQPALLGSLQDDSDG